MSRRAFALGALLLVLVAAAPARASLFDTYGFGARSTSMGNALTALGVNYEATYYNPANLLVRKRTHLGFGLNYLAPQLDVERLSGRDGFEAPVPGDNLGFHLGVSTSIGGVFQDKLGLGVVLFHPLVKLTRIESIDPSVPFFYRYQNLADKLILAFALAAEPVDWLRIGAGIQVLGQLEGGVTANVSLTEGRFTQETIDIRLKARAAPTAGLSLGPFRGFRVGVAWRSRLELSYDLPVDVLIEDVGRLLVKLEGTSLYTPDQLAVGVGWESAPPSEPGLAAEVGFTWARWSIAPPAGAMFDLRVDDSDLRDDGGEPEDLIVSEGPALPLGARDTITPRAGLEWRPDDVWAVRAGYFWRPTPLPVPAYQTNSMDATAHVLSLGGGVQFDDPTEVHRVPLIVDLAVQLTVLKRRTVEKAPDGTPDGSYRFGGVIWNVVLDLRHDF